MIPSSRLLSSPPHPGFRLQLLFRSRPAADVLFRPLVGCSQMLTPAFLPLLKNRFRLEGGLRWARLDTLRVQPFTGQLSPLPLIRQRARFIPKPLGSVLSMPPSGVSPSYLRRSLNCPCNCSKDSENVSRFRAEAFDRQNEQREDIFLLSPTATLKQQLSLPRLTHRGLQFRCCKAAVAIIGFLDSRLTLLLLSSRTYDPVASASRLFRPEPHPILHLATNGQQPVNLLCQLSLHATFVFFSVESASTAAPDFRQHSPPPIVRIGGPYDRLDLRADKSWPCFENGI